MWLHSSVGRASHRYCGGHGFESRWSPDFFFRLLLSNCLNWKIYCDDHYSLSSISTKKNYFIKTSHKIFCVYYENTRLNDGPLFSRQTQNQIKNQMYFVFQVHFYFVTLYFTLFYWCILLSFCFYFVLFSHIFIKF